MPKEETTPTPTPAGAPVAVVVEGKPLEGVGAPDTERAEFMRRHEAMRELNDPTNLLAARVADSGLAYYDDNPANRRYITKIADDAVASPFGSPLVSLQRKPFPADDALAGTLVIREDGSQFTVPPGVRSIEAVTDPESGKPLVDEVDAKKHKARVEAAGLADFVTLKPDGTVEAKESKKK
jgi:hypothetical protein